MIGSRLEGARLAKYPQPAQLYEYHDAAAEMEALLLELPGLIAIYRTGSVSVPGISDLDLVAVVEEPSGTLPSFWDRLSPRSRELAMHSPFVVDRPTFVRHRSFAYLEPLELVAGTALEIEERPQVDVCEVLIGIEGLLSTLLRLAKQAAAGRVKVRPTLCELHSVRHDLRLLRLERDRAPSAWDFAEGIESLRTDWFEETEGIRISRLRALLRNAGPAIWEALGNVAGDLIELDEVRRMTLGGTWSNVTIVAGGDSFDLRSRPGLSIALRLGRGRVAELAWRLGRHELIVPGPVVSLLAKCGTADAGFLRDRRTLVQRYRRLMSEEGRGYSALGGATALCP